MFRAEQRGSEAGWRAQGRTLPRCAAATGALDQAGRQQVRRPHVRPGRGRACATCGACGTPPRWTTCAAPSRSRQPASRRWSPSRATMDEVRDAVVPRSRDALDVAQGMASSARELAEETAAPSRTAPQARGTQSPGIERLVTALAPEQGALARPSGRGRAPPARRGRGPADASSPADAPGAALGGDAAVMPGCMPWVRRCGSRSAVERSGSRSDLDSSAPSRRTWPSR